MLYRHLHLESTVQDTIGTQRQYTDPSLIVACGPWVSLGIVGMDVVIYSQYATEPFKLEHPRCFAQVVARVSQLANDENRFNR